MSDDPVPIPPPPVVRDRLARNIREGRLLRRLLRLSREPPERHLKAGQRPPDSPPAREGPRA